MALEIIELDTEPVGNPATGYIYRWADSVSGLPKAKDSAGTVYDFTGPAGAAGATGPQGPAGPAGSGFVIDWAEAVGESLNETTTFDSYLQKNITINATGNYEILFSWQWSCNDAAQDCIVQAIIDGTTYELQREEPKDAAGAGTSGTDQRLARSLSIVHNFASTGIKSFDLQFAGSTAGDSAALYRGFFRVGILT